MRSFVGVFLVLAFSYLANAQNLYLNEIQSANVTTLADEDSEYVDWIEIYNGGAVAVNLNGYGLSDDPTEPFKWIFPSTIVPNNGFLLVFASGKDRTTPTLHTNFKIKSSGESIVLTHSSGMTLDAFDTGYIPSDISRGRQPNGGSSWDYFADPTPDSSNITLGYSSISSPPIFSLPAGFYTGAITLALTSPALGANIRYTRDGSPPDDSSSLYTTPIFMDSSSVIRARAFEPSLLFSDAITQSYIFYDNHDLAVFSLATDPYNLWDENYGIYVLGPHPGPPPNYPNANYWQDWERPMHIEFFEPEGELGFSLDGGVKIHGGWSRNLPQKPLALYARDAYCFEEIPYQVFPNLPINEFQSLILRNSGEDWFSTMMRDGFMTGLVNEIDLDTWAYRPSLIFLNGVYWGILNIREKLDENFLATHHNVDPDNVDLLEHDGSLVTIEGDDQDYLDLLTFIVTHNLTLPENYNYVKTQMNVYNYMDYFATEMYIANTDWPAFNVRLWHTQQPDGLWRWILHDTDWGFGLLSSDTTNMFVLAAQQYPFFPACNAAFVTLLSNLSFRNDFINRFADLLNVDFHPDRVQARIDSVAGVIAAEIPFHKARWSQTMTSWYNGIDTLHQFAANRMDYVREDIEEFFGLPGQAVVTLHVQPANGGQIQINSKTIEHFPWQGVYFRSVPIQLTALPNLGFRFSGWLGALPADSATVLVNLTRDTTITATFAADDTAEVVITEINYNSAPNFDPEDWVELYNNSDQNVNLSGWSFKDSEDPHQFIIPANTMLAVEGLLVLCRDTAAFTALFPAVGNYIGNFDFGLSNNGELIRLFNAQGLLMDSLTFNDSLPWPPEPNGFGPTLELIHPDSANYLPANWRASQLAHGSPGQPNGWVAAPLVITLTPFGTPIVIPPNGGSFNFNIAVSNLNPTPATFDLWTVVQLPGTGTVPIINMPNLTLPGNFSANRNRMQAVPGNAPAGTYIYWGYVGDYPWTVVNYDSFTFSKAGELFEGSLGLSENWVCSGESFENLTTPELLPENFALLAPYPNPMNPSAVVRYQMPEASHISLQVFDTAGRLVATLVNGKREAGTHGVTFEGSLLPSGLYFCRLQAGEVTAVKKMVLVK